MIRNSIEIWIYYNSVHGYNMATKFCTCHDSMAVVACAKFCGDEFMRSRTRWKLIMMQKLLMKWPPVHPPLSWLCPTTRLVPTPSQWARSRHPSPLMATQINTLSRNVTGTDSRGKPNFTMRCPMSYDLPNMGFTIKWVNIALPQAMNWYAAISLWYQIYIAINTQHWILALGKVQFRDMPV